LSFEDDGIAEITATLRFDRAILLFWYCIDYQAVANFYKNCFIKPLTYKNSFSIFVLLQYIKRIFLWLSVKFVNLNLKL
jgi:hypothetical protein